MLTAIQDRRIRVRTKRGFTLLELVIVLAVMVGMLAVVWPNLARPLQRTSLDEAAQMVRDAIDESRYQSALRGAPYFVRLQQGSSQLYSGSFESFLNADSDVSSLLPSTASGSGAIGSGIGQSASDGVSTGAAGSSPSGAVRSQPKKTWELPASVVVSRVDWTLAASYASGEDDSLGMAGTDEAGESSSAAALDANNSNLPATSSTGIDLAGVGSTGGNATGRQWWLPLTATGRGRDASIELFDASINQRLRVTYSSATGALEISR